MKISLGADQVFPIVDEIRTLLRERGDEFAWHGPINSQQTINWVKAATNVTRDVESGRADEGILCCWAGTGVSIAANKVRGIRVA